MKKIFIILSILTQFSIVGYSQDLPTLQFNTTNRSIQQKSIKCSNVKYLLEYGRGCCSHHGGVCGCSNGRALCCDGTLSPSCGCMNEKPILNSNI